MPSLDLYQQMSLDDKDGIQCFLLAHRIRHDSYGNAAALAGTQTSKFQLGYMPDDQWFLNHANVHISLQKFMIQDQSVDLTILSQYSWDTQSNFDTWMRMHTLIHQRLDQGFGVFS